MRKHHHLCRVRYDQLAFAGHVAGEVRTCIFCGHTTYKGLRRPRKHPSPTRPVGLPAVVAQTTLWSCLLVVLAVVTHGGRLRPQRRYEDAERFPDTPGNLPPIGGGAVAYFWVGGTGTWDGASTTHWSLTTGGASGAGPPTNVDTANFDANSGTAATVTFATGGAAANVTVNKSDLTLTHTAGSTFSGTLTFTSGTIDTNNQNCSWNIMSSPAGAVRAMTLGTSTITITGTGTCWTFGGGASNVTLSAASSTINFTGAAPTLSPGEKTGAIGLTYGTVTFNSTGNVTIASPQNIPPTFGTLTVNGPSTANFTFTINIGASAVGAIVVTGTFTVTGFSTTQRVMVQSSVDLQTATITAGASSTNANVDFQDIAGTGAAVPFTGTSMGDCQGNSGITFDASVPQSWTSNVSGNASDVTKWTSRVPLPQDDVTIAVLGAGKTITVDIPRLGRNIDCTGSTGGTFNLTTTLQTFGALTTVGVTIGGTSIWNFAGRSNYTITAVSLGANAPTFMSGVYTLGSALSCTNVLTVSATGNFVAAGFALTVRNIIVANSSGTFDFTNSTITLNPSSATATVWTMGAVVTLTSTGSTIIVNPTTVALTFAGSGKTYNNLTINGVQAGTFTISGANVFTGNITYPPQTIIAWPASVTNTVGGLVGSGQNNGYVALPGLAGNYASSPDAAPVRITGNITVDVQVAMPSWSAPAVGAVFASKYGTAGSISWSFQSVVTTGKLALVASVDGTTLLTFTSSVGAGTVFAAGATGWVRASLNLTNGSNSVCQFFTSPDGATWTQLGTNVSLAIMASLFNTTADVEIGARVGGTLLPMQASFYRTRIFNSALGSGSGTPVFDANFTTKAFGANTFTESSTNAATVTINGAAAQAGDGRVGFASSTPGTKATLSCPNLVNNDYMVVTDSTASGNIPFYAGRNSVLSSTLNWQAVTLFPDQTSGGPGVTGSLVEALLQGQPILPFPGITVGGMTEPSALYGTTAPVATIGMTHPSSGSKTGYTKGG